MTTEKLIITVYGVKWDGKSGLPSTVVLPTPNPIPLDDEEMCDYICDALSNEYGYCHHGWDHYITKRQAS